MSLTPQEIEAFGRAHESAARIYCEKVGIDPEEIVNYPHPLISGAHLASPRWELVAQDLADLSLRLVCMREATTQQGRKNGRIVTNA